MSAAGKTVPKKSRYLTVALVVALMFGIGCWSEGCERIALYDGEHQQAMALNASINVQADRERVQELYTHYVDVAYNARGRAVPASAAIFVLGAALLALASRGLAGRAHARRPLVQVVAVQAVVVVIAYFLTQDVRSAELTWANELVLAHQREALPPEDYERVAPVLRATLAIRDPAWLVLRTIASALIIVALTRQRSREFFEAASNAVSDQ